MDDETAIPSSCVREISILRGAVTTSSAIVLERCRELFDVHYCEWPSIGLTGLAVVAAATVEPRCAFGRATFTTGR